MRTWETRKTVGAVAVAAAIAGFGGSAIAAAADGGFHAMSGGMHGGGPPNAMTPPHRYDEDQESLHGERVVVANDRGGFETLVTQTGVVTAISPTSVTARSDDGFAQTYAIHEIAPAIQPPFRVNDRVTINAKREGEAVVITTIRPPLLAGH
jgi:hypothetical protein